jgi:hypothetical protein
MESQSNNSAVISQKKRSFAISAIVLGAIYVLTTLWGLIYTIDPHLIPATTKTPLPEEFRNMGLIFGAISFVIALAFLAGGLLTIKGKTLGVAILTYVPMAAIAVTLLQAYFNYEMLNSSAYITYMTTTLESNPQITPDMVPKIMVINEEIGLGLGILFGIVQIIYCIVLFLQMSVETPLSTSEI